MKSILLVTSLYPLPTKENNCTYVCHYFTKEWVKMGYNVRVIHLQPVHTWGWHLLVRFFGKQLANWAGGGNFYARKIKHTEQYDMDGVRVFRVPVFNFIPRGRYPHRSLNRFICEVHSILKKEGFNPDIITAHAIGLYIIPELNKPYGAKTCMVTHGMSSKIKHRFPNYRELIEYYNLWGFRNAPSRDNFMNEFGEVKHSFLCHSGIPKKSITQNNNHLFDNKTVGFAFVGEFIERKYPGILMSTVPTVYDNYKITYIGDGPLRKQLINQSVENNLSEKVLFTGKLPREKVCHLLDNIDCLIMISKGEAFGLVYLEAMARGCLVVASKNEGFDGIIKDGENGFLCKAGNVDELIHVLERIKQMSIEEKRKISDNAIKTAINMTDELVAKQYLNELLNM